LRSVTIPVPRFTGRCWEIGPACLPEQHWQFSSCNGATAAKTLGDAQFVVPAFPVPCGSWRARARRWLHSLFARACQRLRRRLPGARRPRLTGSRPRARCRAGTRCGPPGSWLGPARLPCCRDTD
jgi:hypothetical protein